MRREAGALSVHQFAPDRAIARRCFRASRETAVDLIDTGVSHCVDGRSSDSECTGVRSWLRCVGCQSLADWWLTAGAVRLGPAESRRGEPFSAGGHT